MLVECRPHPKFIQDTKKKQNGCSISYRVEVGDDYLEVVIHELEIVIFSYT